MEIIETFRVPLIINPEGNNTASSFSIDTISNSQNDRLRQNHLSNVFVVSTAPIINCIIIF